MKRHFIRINVKAEQIIFLISNIFFFETRFRFVAQTDFELTAILPQLPECHINRHELPHLSRQYLFFSEFILFV